MSDIEASLRLDIAQYQAALARAQGEIKRLKETARKEGAGLGKALFGAMAAYNVGGLLMDAGKSAVQTVVEMDRLRRALEAAEGSAEGAKLRMDELREVAKLPGVGFDQAVKADVRLRSAGLSAETSRKSIIEFGNALALAGASSADLDGVILALGQIASKGKVSAEEINQIGDRVPQIKTVMKDVFGTTDTEALQKMGIASDVFIDGILEGFAKLTRATPGLDESLAAIDQTIRDMTNDGMGPLVQQLIPALEDMSNVVAQNSESFKFLGETSAKVLGGMVHGLKAAGEALGVVSFALMGDNSQVPLDPKMAQRLSPEQRAAFNSNSISDPASFGMQALADNQVAKEREMEAARSARKETQNKAKRERMAEFEQKKTEASSKQIRAEEERLADARMKDYMSILPPNLKLLEVQRQILDIKQQMQVGPLQEMVRLKLEREIVALTGQERDIKKKIVDDQKKAAEDAIDAEREKIDAIMRQNEARARMEEEKAGQELNMAQFEAEMAIIQARVQGRERVAREMERELAIAREAKQIMQSLGVDEAKALEMARKKVELEDALKNKQAGGDRAANGRKRINAHIEGGVEGARDRAAARGEASRARVAEAGRKSWDGLAGWEAKKGTSLRDEWSFPGLDGMKGAGAAGKPLDEQAARNAAGKAPAEDNAKAAQTIIQLVTSIVEAVK